MDYVTRVQGNRLFTLSKEFGFIIKITTGFKAELQWHIHTLENSL